MDAERFVKALEVVFPIRGKILKPEFRVAEKRKPGKPVFFRVLK